VKMAAARSILFLLFLTNSLAANFVSNALGDNMVLQRNQKSRLWGWTKPGSQVKGKITGDEKTYSAIADKTGHWIIELDARGASFDPHNITLGSTGGETQTLTNILFGDVVLCSGQSNMQFSVAGVFNASEEIKRASQYPFIRLFTVGTSTTSLTPLAEFRSVEQGWSVASASSVGNGVWSHFSATCWFYGTHLAESIKVPLGLLSSNWGGTLVQAWSGPDALAKCKQPETFDEPNDTDLFGDQISADPSPGTDSVLYNAMIVPILPMRFKNAVWYQGESNAGQAAYYACQFPAMISDWRQKLGYEGREFGFYFVQLAPWEPADNNALGEIRNAQLAALKLPAVGFATAADLGDDKSPQGNIHPRNKQEVGRRLALASEAISYGENVKWRGPTFSTFAQIDQSSIAITFDPSTIGSRLIQKEFSCPVDAQFCVGFEVLVANAWQMAKISTVRDGTVHIAYGTAGDVKQVRYGWSAWPALTLYNSLDLPAPPFISEAKW